MPTLSLEELKELTSVQPSFVYPWACNRAAGFGANHSGLTKCLTSAIRKGIGFKLVRLNRPSGIAIASGYCDYFLPFCDDISGLLLEPLNHSPLPFQAKFPAGVKLASKILRLSTKATGSYYVFDNIEKDLDTTSSYASLPYGDLRASISKAIWRYQPEVSEAIENIKQEVASLTHPYIATVVRRGDKIIESSYAEFSQYVKRLLPYQGIAKQIFISGDDISAIQDLAKRLPMFECIYLEPPFQTGYNNSTFRSLDRFERRSLMIRFLAQVDILKSAYMFFATRTTNVSHIVNAFSNGGRTIWID